MKYTKWLVALLGVGSMVTSCVDDFDTNDFVVSKPGSRADYEYLKEYEPLKNYLDRSAHPNFKVSAALDAEAFNSKGNVFTIARANFDEVVAGNAMKMSSVVSDKGDFNYGTVQNFVATAEEGGVTIYGHTLGWHAQQPVKWLNTLIADKPKPVDPNGETTVKEVEVAVHTYTDGPFPFYPMGSEPPIIDGSIHFEPTGEWSQFFCCPATGLTEGNYGVILKIKSSVEGKVSLTAQNGWGDDAQSLTGNVPVSTDWEEVLVKFDGIKGGNYDFILKPETFEGILDLNSVTIIRYEVQSAGDIEYKEVWTNQITNSQMNDGESMDCFIVRDSTSPDDHPGTVAVGEGPNGTNCLIVKGKTNPAEEWDTQFFIYTPNKKWEAGEKYKLHMWYKATTAIGTDTQVHGTPGGYIHWQMLSPNPAFTTEWQEKTWEGTIPSEGGGNQQTIAFNLNKNKESDPGLQIDYYFADISWESCTLVEVPKVEIVHIDYVENSDMEGTEAKNFVRKENNGALENVITDGVGRDGSRGVQVLSRAGAAEDWDTQFWIKLNEPLEEGSEVTVQFDYKASTNASADTQAHGEPGDYAHWACVGTVNFTTEWQSYNYNLKVDGSMASKGGLGSIAFNLSKDRGQDVTYYFDNIKVFTEREEEIKSTIPLTPEEKRDTLTWAMKKWIDGMMAATEGKVKAWDLINEAVSGGGDVNGYYDLQHAREDAPNDFFWQDYFGSDQYGVIMEKLAREAYAAQEGANPADLKLFINDYNLESTWDDNKKLKSLIYWIGVWEANGAKIDGIGSQMHISYFLDADDQKRQKEHITTMLELMAATGKLVRISELDMGVCEKQFGDALTTDDIISRPDGVEIEKAMADYYQWIIEEYFRIVPAAQQYGICQWCITDSPKSSGWRPEEPVGLWYLDYTRKPAYAGWAEGLKK